MADKNTYDMIVRCTNCGEPNQMDVPKGTLKVDFQKAFICTNCECKIVIEEVNPA